MAIPVERSRHHVGLFLRRMGHFTVQVLKYFSSRCLGHGQPERESAGGFGVDGSDRLNPC